jgi:Putative transposase
VKVEISEMDAGLTALEMAADPKRLGAEIGMIAILHTWGQNLLLHPHIHGVIPAGGISLDHHRWVSSRHRFFLPLTHHVYILEMNSESYQLKQSERRRGSEPFPA